MQAILVSLQSKLVSLHGTPVSLNNTLVSLQLALVACGLSFYGDFCLTCLATLPRMSDCLASHA